MPESQQSQALGKHPQAHRLDDPIVERLARSAHEAIHAFCESVGDITEGLWDSADPWERESTIGRVKNVLAGLSPVQVHGAWLEQLRVDGWTYGAAKRIGKKEHPNILPFNALPARELAKDSLFRSVVITVASAILDALTPAVAVKPAPRKPAPPVPVARVKKAPVKTVVTAKRKPTGK